MQNNIGYL